jgi:hypothetical protein
MPRTNNKKNKTNKKAQAKKVERPSEELCFKLIISNAFLYGYNNVNVIFCNNEKGWYFSSGETFDDILQYVNKYKKHINTGGGSFNTYIKNISEKTKKNNDSKVYFYIVDGYEYDGFNYLYAVSRDILRERVKKYEDNERMKDMKILNMFNQMLRK